jgi:hypothetical protein
MRSVLAGLVAALVVYALSRSVRATPKQHAGRNWIEYSTGYKFLSGLFFPLSAFVTYAATQASPDQKALAGLIALAFWFGTLYLAYEISFVSLSYDEAFIYHRTPLRGSRQIPRTAVVGMSYSPLTQAIVLNTDGYGDVSISEYANGAQALIEAIEIQINH